MWNRVALRGQISKTSPKVTKIARICHVLSRPRAADLHGHNHLFDPAAALGDHAPNQPLNRSLKCEDVADVQNPRFSPTSPLRAVDPEGVQGILGGGGGFGGRPITSSAHCGAAPGTPEKLAKDPGRSCASLAADFPGEQSLRTIADRSSSRLAWSMAVEVSA
jgi:hypothetical protein